MMYGLIDYVEQTGSTTIYQMTQYSDPDEALAELFNRMRLAINTVTINTRTVVLIRQDGAVLRRESFTR